MKWTEFVTDYLSFSRRDRIAIISILALILAIFFLPQAISSAGKKTTSLPDTAWVEAMKKIEQKETNNDDEPPGQYKDNNNQDYPYERTKTGYSGKSKEELFYFDPNTLTADGWEKLGLRDKTIKTILNYLSKGGKFKKQDDLQRIYGLHRGEYERLEPFIRIVPTVETGNKNEFANKPNDYAPSPKSNKPAYSIVDINTADTSAFIALPGIGSKLAARIVNFRDKLGGFYSVNQVAETFGLPDSTFQKIKQYIKLENVSVKKININTVTVDELKAHPYIKWSIANPIVAYRSEHGAFQKIEDIKKVMAVTEEVYKKLAPYLTLE
jgi:competence protein ComEA